MHLYALDNKKLSEAIKAKGYRSFSEVAKKIGVHRNTLSNLITGQSVFPKSLTMLFEFLDLDGRQYISLTQEGFTVDSIAFLVDALLGVHPRCCIVLFGSRARGDNKKFSDFDLGIYSSQKLTHKEYLKLIEVKEEVCEDFPATVQVVNLNRADSGFLEQISQDIRFLGGRMSDWLALKASMQ